MFVFSSAIQTSPPVGGEKKSGFTTLFYRFPLIFSTPKIPCGPRSVTGTPSNTVTPKPPNPKVPATPLPQTPRSQQHPYPQHRYPSKISKNTPAPRMGVWLLLPRPFHPGLAPNFLTSPCYKKYYTVRVGTRNFTSTR